MSCSISVDGALPVPGCSPPVEWTVTWFSNDGFCLTVWLWARTEYCLQKKTLSNYWIISSFIPSGRRGGGGI